MKREAKLLLTKACDSLVLSIEFFNRPHDRGRVNTTLILLDHGFEMLMKAAILHRGGRIRDRQANETIGFNACLQRSLSTDEIKYLTKEQAIVLRTINSLRDAAQHYLIDISEAQLYIHIQSGITVFRDLLRNVFEQDLITYLPTRVLPVSTSPPMDLATLFEFEVSEVVKLLRPGRRRRIEALSKLRPLAILDNAIRGEEDQPSDQDLTRLSKDVSAGRAWDDVFRDVATVEITTEGFGPSLSLRFSKKEGMPIRIVEEGTPDASVVGLKRVDELGFYNLGAKDLAEKVSLTIPKMLAVVEDISLRDHSDCYKEIKIGKSVHKRYSQKAIREIQKALEHDSIDEIWYRYKRRV